MIDRTCGRPTKKGASCRASVHSWLEGFEVRRADGCWTHMDAKFRDATERRREKSEAAWQAYLSSDPACWGWATPNDLGSWTYPQGTDIDQRLSDDVVAIIMGDPESRAAAILEHWQNGRCAICGHRSGLVEDHDHVTGLVRGYLCRGCNTQEGIHRGDDNLFGRYRHRHPTLMLGLRIRYWDPFLNDYAPALRPAATRRDNPMRGIGL